MKTYEQRMKSIQKKARRVLAIRLGIKSVVTTVCLAAVVLCGFRFGADLIKLGTDLFMPTSGYEGQPTSNSFSQPTSDPTVPTSSVPGPVEPVQLEFQVNKLMSAHGPGQEEAVEIINSVEALNDFRGKLGVQRSGISDIAAQIEKYDAGFFETHSLVSIIRGVESQNVVLDIKNIYVQESGGLDIFFNRSKPQESTEIAAYWYFFVELNVKVPTDQTVTVKDVQDPIVPSASLTVEGRWYYQLSNNALNWEDQYGSIHADGAHPMQMALEHIIFFNTVNASVMPNWSLVPTTITVECWDIQYHGREDWKQYTQTAEVIDGQIQLKPGTYVYEVRATWSGNDLTVGNGHACYAFVADYIVTEPGTEGLYYELLEDGTYQVSGFKLPYEIPGEIVIPATYNGVRVTQIKAFGFSTVSQLKKITIPDTVTVIGERAFSGCFMLSSVTMPKYLTQIGYEAFCLCSKLTEITIPYSVTVIPEKVFERCTKLATVTIPASVTRIEEKAFATCTALKDIYFDGTVDPAERRKGA